MGANESKEPEKGKASEFYFACRNNEYEKVKSMLSSLSYEQINQLQPNGSTALHAATYYTHPRIVKLLIDQGCSRTVLNRYGHTAYEEAKTQTMRSLFHRPSSQRFIDDDPTQSFGLTTDSDSEEDFQTKDGVPDNWVKGYSNRKYACEANFMHAVAHAPFLMRKVLQNRLEEENKELFENFVYETVNEEEAIYDRVKHLVQDFKTKKSVEALFTLYTLETPLYGALQDDCEAFTTLLYLHLSKLKDRAYQGIAYRGGRMTYNDIEAYRWALRQKDRVLETRTIQSMSKDKHIALEFANTPNQSRPISVLLTFDFPELCPTAIDLNKTSGATATTTTEALSDFQHEEEVTLLPFTLFKVLDVRVDAKNSRHYRITLQNVSVKKKSVSGAWFGML